MTPSVVPESGVQIIDGRMYAAALPCWLRLEPTQDICRHRWIRIRYSSGFFDELERPLIRFVTLAKTYIQPLNGAVLGSSEWIGRVPDGTISVSISPTSRLGPFAFRVERIDAMSRFALILRGFLNDPAWAFWAVRSRLINSREEAWQALKFALGGAPFTRYHQWHARMARSLEMASFDLPRSDWASAPTIRVVMSLDGDDANALHRTLGSLRTQVFGRWSLHACAGTSASANLVSVFRGMKDRDRRLLEFSPETPPTPHQLGFSESDWIAPITIGDTFPDYALAIVAEAIANTPGRKVLYCDEDAQSDGRLHSPALKPDWSPIFNEEAHYVRRPLCISCAALRELGLPPSDILSNEEDTVLAIFAAAQFHDVGHIRRILYRNHGSHPRDPVVATLKRRKALPDPPHWPSVSIVVPTRDRADLLTKCIHGITQATDYPSINVVVVDNDSADPAAVALLTELAKDERFRIIKSPGRFNYSVMSNSGARESASDMLVFLNNDVETLESNWLKELVRWAIRPEVGAVGARLLFPNGRIQHAGVVVGMGGISGHVYRHSSPGDSGYLNQLLTARESLAVTGACLAIERKKFAAIGGFNEDELAVDLNDIDLCLRIAESGLTNLWTPNSILTHVQSASRGIDRDPFKLYHSERNYFSMHWREAIRDDPYFHCALSLFSQTPALA